MKAFLSIIVLCLLFSCSQIIKNDHELLIINKTDVLQNVIINDNWVTLNALENKVIVFDDEKLTIQYHNHETELYYIDIILNLDEFGISIKCK